MSFGLKRVLLITGLILSLFLSTSLVFNHIRPAHAATDPAYAWIGEGVWENIKGKVGEIWERITCTTNVHCWVRNATTSAASYGLYVVMGTDVEEIREAASLDDAFASGYGLLGGVGKTVAAVYNNPADIHFATFFKEKLANNLFVSPAYATVGTDILHPIYMAWEVIRNIAYSVFIVIVAAISVMIILRRQIDPRTVVTVTQALPRILISLILITLSYPIVGLFIDVFVVWLPAILTQQFSFAALRSGIESFITDQGADVGDASLFSVLGDTPRYMAISMLMAASSATTGLTILFVLLLMVVAAFFIFGFVLLQLLYRYARIMILTVLAPLYLLLGALPGQEGSITNWFKDLAVQTLTFPGILFVIYLALIILESAGLAALSAQRLEEIPGLGSALISAASGIVLPVVALIILLFSFKIPGLIESAIKGNKGK